jgi:hypothetical protein
VCAERVRASLVRVPRPGGGERLLARLGTVDADAYARAVAGAAPAIERALGPNVLANRMTRAGLADWRPAWGRLVRWVRAARREGAELAVLDVRDFFASVSPPVADRALAALGCDARDVRAVLERTAGDGVPGLPVGPSESAVLANAVLLPVDRAVRDVGLAHVRWVDDLVIAAPTRRAARGGIDRARRALEPLGLDAHPEKTRVPDGDPGSTRLGSLALP